MFLCSRSSISLRMKATLYLSSWNLLTGTWSWPGNVKKKIIIPNLENTDRIYIYVTSRVWTLDHMARFGTYYGTNSHTSYIILLIREDVLQWMFPRSNNNITFYISMLLTRLHSENTHTYLKSFYTPIRESQFHQDGGLQHSMERTVQWIIDKKYNWREPKRAPHKSLILENRYTFVCMYVCLFVGSCLATKVFIGNLPATRRGWVIIK